MKNEFSKHEIDYIKKYEKQGYTHNFRYENNKLINISTKEEFVPEDIFIVAENRFEGMSDPSDSSILYVIKTKSECKGTILVNYSPKGDLDVAYFFKNIPKENYLKNTSNK
ncbi:hypothetical protein [Lutibacter sp. B1]|uniref:hypothetical protein n=1 Tax=Lutibacter sp. B1 TaxID=2725996 RepID=UPI0014570C19|nr:hypothetical protein [Lutibacter sp. B1]NLP58653.1 hypothetical protein [Lutibacter sp. B1]